MLIDYLCGEKIFGIFQSAYSKKDVLKMVNIRYAMYLNRFQKYVTATVAYDVSEETTAAIMENQDVLQGINIEEDAKELLTKTEAMIEAQAKQNNVTVDENGEEITVDEAEVEEEVENEATETVEPDPDSGEDTETIENDENDQPDEKIIEEEEEKKKKRTETRSLEDENDQNGCEIDEPEDEKVEPDEEIEAKNEENDKKTTDNDEKVDNSQEFRTLLEKFKTEVPEIE